MDVRHSACEKAEIKCSGLSPATSSVCDFHIIIVIIIITIIAVIVVVIVFVVETPLG